MQNVTFSHAKRRSERVFRSELFSAIIDHSPKQMATLDEGEGLLWRKAVEPLNPLPQHFTIPQGIEIAGTSGSKLLAIERSKASFSSHDMAKYVIGDEALERQERLLGIITKEEAFDKSRIP